MRCDKHKEDVINKQEWQEQNTGLWIRKTEHLHKSQYYMHIKMTIGAFPHTKKARFESRFKSRLFLRVSTQAEKKRDLNRDYFFYACPHTGRKIATQIAPVRASCACVLFVNRQRTQTAERPPCMMGYKKPVRFSFTVLTHFAQKIVAIISNNRDYFQKDALLVVRGSRSESH